MPTNWDTPSLRVHVGCGRLGASPGQQPRDAGEGHPAWGMGEPPTVPHKDKGTLCIGLHVCCTPGEVGTLTRPLQRRGHRYKRGWDLPKVTGRKWQSWGSHPMGLAFTKI